MSFSKISISELVGDKLVLVALPGSRAPQYHLHAQGARDVLVLDPRGPEEPCRKAEFVHARYRRLKDLRTNNCQVAVFHGRAVLTLSERRKFARFSRVLVPLGPSLLLALPGLLRYFRRSVLRMTGVTSIDCSGRRRRYVVFTTKAPVRDQRRQYGPTGLTPLETLRELSDVPYVALNLSEKIASGEHEGDIDLLVARAGLDFIKERFERCISTRPIDIYADDGHGGHGFNGVPFFTAALAKGLLDSAVLDDAGLRVASPRWQFLAYCYHLLFHAKSEHISPGTSHINEATFEKPCYYEKLQRLAAMSDCSVPQTFDEIEALLREAAVFPSIDLIGFYSNRNPFLKKRYFEGAPVKPGLATFFIRDFGKGLDRVDFMRAQLEKQFTILAEGPVDETMRASVIQGVRGGNWVDDSAPGGVAHPVYWFVCWDPSPLKPSRRTLSKHPRVDNDRVRIKDDLRDELSASFSKSLRVVHSSDNALEALDHIERLGLKDHPEIGKYIKKTTLNGIPFK